MRRRRITAFLLTLGMIAGLFSACGETKETGDKEKIPVLFSIPEGSEEKLAVTGKAVYTGEDELTGLYLDAEGSITVLRDGEDSLLNDAFQPVEWKTAAEEESPHAAYGEYELRQDKLLVGGKEISLEENSGESRIGFWSFEGITYLVTVVSEYDIVNIEEETDRYTVLYPVTEKGLGDPVRAEGLTPTGRAAGTDGEWNYFVEADTLYRTDGKSLQSYGNLTPYGVNPSALRSIVPVDGDRVLLLSGSNLFLFTAGETKAEEQNGGKRRNVVLGVEFSYGVFFQNALIQYNMSSDTKVEVKEYGSIEKLNLALLSKEVDMVASIDAGVLEGYAAKGLLAPLDDVIGETIASGEIFPNVLEAGRINGKVYMVPDAAMLGGMMLPKTVVEEKGGRFADMKELIATLDGLEKQSFYYYLTKEQALTNFLDNGVSAWVDLDAGTCHFEDENFIAMLELCGRYAPDQDTVFANESSAKPLFIPFRRMENPIGYLWLNAYEDVKGSEKTTSPYGLDGRLFPSPTEKDGEFALLPDMVFGVAEYSDAKEGAGEFLEWLLSPACQDLTEEMFVNAAGMPVRIDSFRKLAEEKAAEASAYYPRIDWEKAAEDGLTLYQSADHYEGLGSEISKIVQEEGLRYLHGEITAEKAAEYIQNRVSIYLAEQG